MRKKLLVYHCFSLITVVYTVYSILYLHSYVLNYFFIVHSYTVQMDVFEKSTPLIKHPVQNYKCLQESESAQVGNLLF